VLRQILPEENRPKIHTNASIPAQAGGDNPVFAGEISLFNYHPSSWGNNRNLYWRYENN
jgi:hypothetical protein